MTIKWQTGETTWFILPRDVHTLMDFLRKKGFDPKMDSIDERICHVNKELFHDRLTDEWHKFTGYDKILVKCLKNYERRSF